MSFVIWGYTELLYLDADVTYEYLKKKVILTEDVQEIQNTADIDKPSDYLNIDHEKLRDENHDYVCWLSACGDKVSYPVVQSRNNDEYLHKTFFGDKSFVGSIFLDYRCTLEDFHVLVYGHSMKDKTMFRLIADYTNEAFARQNAYFYLYTDEGRRKYNVFSVCSLADTELITATGDPDAGRRRAFIKELTEKSLFGFDITPTEQDQIVTLITCDVKDDSKRIAVSGVHCEE